MQPAITANFTLSYNGTVRAPGSAFTMCAAANPNCPSDPNLRYVASLNAASTSPQPAGISFLWQVISGGGSLSSTSGATPTWSTNCLGTGNSNFTLTIRLTASAPGFTSGQRELSWSLVVNQCGSDPIVAPLALLGLTEPPTAGGR